jgi:hypothetical protein
VLDGELQVIPDLGQIRITGGLRPEPGDVGRIDLGTQCSFKQVDDVAGTHLLVTSGAPRRRHAR